MKEFPDACVGVIIKTIWVRQECLTYRKVGRTFLSVFKNNDTTILGSGSIHLNLFLITLMHKVLIFILVILNEVKDLTRYLYLIVETLRFTQSDNLRIMFD